MTAIWASAVHSPWSDFLRYVFFQFDEGSRVPLVLRGTTILGLACGVVGAFLLLRKRSLVADALSHAALPGVCVGFLLAVWLGSEARFGVEPRSLIVLIPAAAIFGLIGVACVHALTQTPRVKEDSAIGVVLSVFFALGVVLLSVIQRSPSGNAAGLNQFIFGQAATMSVLDTQVIFWTAVCVVVTAVVSYKELKLLCFDDGFARSLGWPNLALDGLLLGMVTVLTVAGLSAVGAILIVALLIIPPAAARFWTDRLTTMIVLSAAMGAIASYVGTAASAAIDHMPTGPAIVVSCGTLFVVSMLVAPKRGLMAVSIQRLALRRTVSRQHLLRAMYEIGEIAGEDQVAIMVHDLHRRRHWSAGQLMRAIRRATRRGEIVVKNKSYQLTEKGHDAAATIVRTHRLWEHFLTTQADIAPSHVDRAADDIEHVLSDDLIRDLEEDLRRQGALPEGEFVPRSAHQLALGGPPLTGPALGGR
jgi:manganese/zinc/iron transport system permease protein